MLEPLAFYRRVVEAPNASAVLFTVWSESPARPLDLSLAGFFVSSSFLRENQMARRRAISEPDALERSSLSLLLRLADESGLSDRQISLEAGLGAHFFSELRGGRKRLGAAKWSNILALEKVLGPFRQSTPDEVHTQNAAEVSGDISHFEILGQEVESVSSWITCTPRSQTHFMSNDMRDWYIRHGYQGQKPDHLWIEGRAKVNSHRNQQRVLDEEYRFGFRHYHLMPPDIFKLSAKVNREWLLDVVRTVRASEGQTVLAIATEEQWRHVAAVIGRELHYYNYSAIDVLDEQVAIVRPSAGGPRYVIRDHDRVSKVRSVLEPLLDQVLCDENGLRVLEGIATGNL